MIQVGEFVYLTRQHCAKNVAAGHVQEVLEILPAEPGKCLRCADCGALFAENEPVARIGRHETRHWAPLSWLRKLDGGGNVEAERRPVEIA